MDEGQGLTRRQLLRWGLVAAGTGVAAVAGGARLYGPAGRWDASLRDAPVFGMLETEPPDYPGLRAAGVTAVVLQVPWSRAQPAPGPLDEGFLREVGARHAAARRADLDLVLSPGMQYAPDWVFALPGGTRFVDQAGRERRGGPGEEIADGVFNPAVRQAQGDYLALLGERLADLELAGVRIGGLSRGELHYPPPGDGAPGNTFWAYGESAAARCPVPGYRPGAGSEQDARAFVEWYLDALLDYGRWQLETVRDAVGSAPRLLVLLPSWGLRPGEVDDAVAGGLDGRSPAERKATLTEGLDWQRQVPAVAAVDGAALCTTWLEPEDQGADARLLSPGRYLTGLAAQHGLGLWGENSGDNTADEMQRCLDRVRELRMEGLFWMSGRRLGQGGNATLDDYARLIRSRAAA